jgi:hypothetical protein
MDRNLTVLMKAESTVAGAQVFAGKRVSTTRRQCMLYNKTKTKTKTVASALPFLDVVSIDTETPLLASHGRANSGAFHWQHRNCTVIYLYSLACALLLHACTSFMQYALAFWKFLCSGGLRSPVAEWTGSTASHGMNMHVHASIMRN